jgi:hypothetical protein
MGLYAKIDVAFARDPDWILQPLSRLMYVQWMCHCRESATDGLCDARLLTLVAAGISHPRQHMDFLVSIGKLDVDPQGWRIPERVWTRWNLTKAEVDALTAAKSEGGSLGNHRRWHKDQPSSECPFCSSSNGSHKASHHRSEGR